MKVDLAILGAVAERRAAEAAVKVDAMHDRYRRDIAAAIKTKSAVDGKAAAPRLALQKRQAIYQDIGDVMREILAEEAARAASTP